MAKKKRRDPPSRKKYERDNPVVSFRVSRKEYDVLQTTKKKEGISNADIMRAGLGRLEVKIRSEAEIWEKAFRQGHRKGYELAESIYKVTFPCSVCGEAVPVEDNDTKEAIKKYLVRDGWGHADCIDRRR